MLKGGLATSRGVTGRMVFVRTLTREHPLSPHLNTKSNIQYMNTPLFTVLVKICHGDAAPPEHKWLANCSLVRGQLMYHTKLHAIENGKITQSQKTESLEALGYDIVEHIIQKGWYY